MLLPGIGRWELTGCLTGMSFGKTEYDTKNLQEMLRQIRLNGYPVIEFVSEEAPYSAWYTKEMQLIFIKKGLIKIRHGNLDFTIGSNQIVLFKKNILVEHAHVSCFGQETVEYIRFNIRSELVKEFTRLTDVPLTGREEQVPVLTGKGEACWAGFMSSLEPYFLRDVQPQDELIKIKMLELIFQLSGIDENFLMQVLDVKEYYRINIMETVEENLLNSLSMYQLASLAGRSLSSFRRDFMAIYNMPPSQWIRINKLRKARELLLSTSMTITDICYSTGFDNIAHFSKLFKSHYGHPPSDYKLHFAVA